MTPEQAEAAVRRLAAELPAVASRALVPMLDGRREAITDALQRDGLGRAVRGCSLTMTTVERPGGAAIELVGLAALLEGGGRTAAHLIEPEAGELLRIGDDVIRGAVQHPGGPVDASGAGAEELRRDEHALAAAVDQAFQAAIDAAGLR